MPRPSSISLGVGFLLLWLEAGTPPALLCAGERAAPPTAEMLLDLDLLTDPDFAASSRDLARPHPAEETELLDNLEWLDAAEARRERQGRGRTRDEGGR